jgi:uncharacterized tellurite resistance protein B-like protein
MSDMDLDLATRRKICQLVAGIITADAKLDTKEAAFVYRVMKGFGIDASQRDAVVPLVDTEAAASLIQDLPRHAQDEALRLLVDAACVDGQIHPHERSYLRAIGAALAIADEDMERRIVGRLMAPR